MKSESPIPPQLIAWLLAELRLVKGMRIDPSRLSARLNLPGVAGAGEGDDDGRNTLAIDCRRLSKLGVPTLPWWLLLPPMLSESEKPRERRRESMVMIERGRRRGGGGERREVVGGKDRGEKGQ